MKILVVDDEAPVRDIVRKGLSQMGGYSVEVAQNGVEAIEKIEQDVFDLVLTDLKMPEMDGIELLKTIKGTRPEVMVIHHDGLWVNRDGGGSNEDRSKRLYHQTRRFERTPDPHLQSPKGRPPAQGKSASEDGGEKKI